LANRASPMRTLRSDPVPEPGRNRAAADRVPGITCALSRLGSGCAQHRYATQGNLGLTRKSIDWRNRVITVADT
jgi:hypothetical protein